MSGTTVGWNNTTPANTDLVGLGDDEIRSLKSNVQGGLDAEHLWPAAGGLAGVHRLGSARIFVGPASQVSSADTSGRLMWDSTNSQLNYVGAEGTAPVGGGRVPSVSTLVVPLSATSRFVISVTSITGNSWPTGPINIGIPPASATLLPYYWASIVTEASGGGGFQPVMPVIEANITNTPKVWMFQADGSQSTATWTVNIFALGYGPL